MNSLEFVYQSLLERNENDLLHDIEEAVRQRDRLLYGLNARTAELAALNKEYDLLKDRYRLQAQQINHLHAVNKNLQDDLRRVKDGGFLEDE